MTGAPWAEHPQTATPLSYSRVSLRGNDGAGVNDGVGDGDRSQKRPFFLGVWSAHVENSGDVVFTRVQIHGRVRSGRRWVKCCDGRS